MSFLKKLFGRAPSEKTRLSLFRGLFSSTISYIVSVSESPRKANEILKDMGREAAEMLFQKYIEVGNPQGDLESISRDFNFAYKTFIGKEFDDIWIFVSKKQRQCEVHFRIYENPTSKHLKSPDPRIKIDNFMTGVMEWSFQLLQDDLNAQEISGEEVKCKAAGDEYCEFKFTLQWNEEATIPLKDRKTGTKILKGKKEPH